MEFSKILTEHILEGVAHRQIVFSISKMFRIYFLYNRDLLPKLSRCGWETVKEVFQMIGTWIFHLTKYSRFLLFIDIYPAPLGRLEASLSTFYNKFDGAVNIKHCKGEENPSFTRYGIELQADLWYMEFGIL